MQPFMINEQRMNTAIQVFVDKSKLLLQPDKNTLMILSELGLYHKARYDDNERLVLDLTPLQWVALGAAMAAVAEIGGYLDDPASGPLRATVAWERA